MSGLRASTIILLISLAFIPALAFSQPAVIPQVACYSATRAILYNGTVLELPSLRPLAQLGPVGGCDIYSGYGEHIAVWRNGQVEVYDGLNRRFTLQGGRAYIGMGFVLVTAKDFAAVYSLHGFQVFRLDSYTTPAYVRLLGAGKAGPKAVLLITPTLCKVGMALRSYILVYDLDLGLWDIYNTGAVSFIPLESGVLWAKNGTLYHNGQAIGEAPDKLYPVNGFDGYAYITEGKVVIVALNGSTYTLPMPSGKGLAVSRLAEGFVACSDFECVCQFNCTGFSEIAYREFAPPAVAETDTHYLLYANTALYMLEKPRPASTAPQSNTTPSGQAPANATPPQNATQPAQAPANIAAPQNSTMPQSAAAAQNPVTPVSNTPSTQQNATQPQPASPKQSNDRDASMLLAIPLVSAIAILVLAGYIFYKRRYRYVS